MAALPSLGTCVYNNVSFGSAARSSISGRYLYDGADRTIVAVVYKLAISTIVQNDAGTDANIQAIDAALSAAGQKLTYKGIGLGNFSINVGGQGAASDVMWGPKPRVVMFKPIGCGQAVEIDWEVEFAIPRCSDAVFTKNLMAFNFEADYSINLGLTTRTITGYIEIPMTRVGGGNTLPDSVDAPGYFESVVPQIPSGFTRRFPTRRVSADKRRIDFTLVDEELPCGGFPPGIIDADGEQTTANATPKNLFQYISTLNATYTVAPGQPKSAASNAFFALLLDRSGVSAIEKSRIYVSFRCSEGLYRNRAISFSCSWMYTSTLVNCLADGGIFRPLPQTAWSTWINSTGVKQAVSPRGSAGMALQASDDAIIDLCKVSAPSTLKGGGAKALALSSPPVVITPQVLDPALSWVDADIRIVVETVFNTVRLKPLPDAVVPTGGSVGEVSAMSINPNLSLPNLNGNSPVNPVPWAGQTTNGKLVSTIATTPDMTDTIQYRATPSYRVLIIGEAFRAGYKVPIPQLTTVGGITPDPRWQRAEEWAAANWSGIPIYGCGFALEYLLDEPPDGAQVQVPGNPALFIAG